MKKLLVLLSLLVIVPSLLAKQKESPKFEIGEKVFLLDKKPFIIKAAEVHYTRIPRPYWEHRIQMCKSLGMNTLCIYIFWNIHEQREGKFDFDNNNDIAEFCRLAQKHGMYVIVRPGPYVCAEWEMGGLPWWLLKKTDIRLRERDPYFMERVKIFEQKVAEQLVPLSIENGGPIIMVQVENEYGSYGEDKLYVSEVRDILREVGWDKTILFQCDWSSNFTKNGLDDLLWTMNFGTGANVKAQFKKLQELRPSSPLMCSEYWSGWFDGWGRGHETRKASAMVAGLKEMLDNQISFSLYMTHGGTSFGHWAGANSPGYKPDCTSYDYDAPISESGSATPKYHELRNLLSQYTDGHPLPEIPKSLPQIEIPTTAFSEVAPSFDNLPKSFFVDSLSPMELYDQGYGSIIYSTHLPQTDGQTLLQVKDVHDFAAVYIDKKHIGNLYRGDNKHSLLLPSLPNGGRLDLYVEGMGRINFGRAIKDYKGITERVLLTTTTTDGKEQSRELKGWDITLLPNDYKEARNKKYVRHSDLLKSHLSSDPYLKNGYYRATFRLKEVGDTYLDMRSWGKGLVWVNGHCLGRFWEIGPQQTLFLPGCWLKKGKNEIIVLDILGPSKAEITGITTPIIDQLRLQRPTTHRAKGETLRLDSTTMIVDGEFAAGNGWQEISFPQSVSGRYVCIEALDNHAHDEYACIAELYLLDKGKKRISREPWMIYYADSEEVKRGNNTADKVFDLQESTFWSTSKGVVFPHSIVIDLGSIQTISALQYLPRMEATVPGAIKQYRIYVSEKPFLKR